MKKVLVVIDMQNDFITGSLGTKEAQQIVNNVIDEIKQKKEEGYLILATQDTHNDDYLESFEGKNLPVDHCIKNTSGWELVDGIKELIEPEHVFQKPTFGSQELMEYLKDYQPDEIEILGLCTDICVISNALMLRALFPDKPIILKENCCAGVTPELHNSAVDVMKSCQVEIQ